MDPLVTGATIPTRIVVGRKARLNRPHFLQQLEGPGASRRFTLEEDVMAIGRAENAEIRLDSQRASRRHAILRRLDEEYSIRDNDSRNGVFLNGLRIHSAVLRDGDLIQVAEAVFLYRDS